MYSKYASTTFSLVEVVVLYSSRNREITDTTEFDMILSVKLYELGQRVDFAQVLFNRRMSDVYVAAAQTGSGCGVTKNIFRVVSGSGAKKTAYVIRSLAPSTVQQRGGKQGKMVYSNSVSRLFEVHKHTLSRRVQQQQ